ncbi:MAG: hypothetical protein DMF60_20510 [Acidobacteria bacterium]|nr:MAG: hypothetical protein DMF60_20510 [Acidobacteriota bacterium]
MFVRGASGRIFRILIALAIATNSALSQTGSNADASLRVSVTDPSGAAVAGAHVQLSASGGKKQMLDTGEQGEVSFSSAAGKCKIRVEAEGFEPRDIEVTLKTGVNRVQAQLEVAHVKQEVVITSDVLERLTSGHTPDGRSGRRDQSERIRRRPPASQVANPRDSFSPKPLRC